jgi:hypothetical protein
MKLSEEKQKEHADNRSEDVQLQVGDPVYLKNNRKKISWTRNDYLTTESLNRQNQSVLLLRTS